MNKLTWHLQGVGTYGWRWGVLGILIKAFYHLHLISEQDAIGYAKGLHDMWLIEIAEKAGRKVIKVDLWGNEE